MKKRQRLFSVAIAATRLNPEFDQEVSEANDLFIFRRRDAPSERTAANGKSGPMDFTVGSVAVVAHDLSEALQQGATIAREAFAERDGWTNHHAFATEIAELQTFQVGLG
jgi:hypothetical protein